MDTFAYSPPLRVPRALKVCGIAGYAAAGFLLGWAELGVGAGLVAAGPGLTLVALFLYPFVLGGRHLRPRLLAAWALRTAGLVATAAGLAALLPAFGWGWLPAVVAVVVALGADRYLSIRAGTSPRQRREGPWLAVPGLLYVARHPRRYLRFRRLGLRLFGHAYVASRSGPPEQWAELRWTARDLRRFLGLEGDDLAVDRRRRWRRRWNLAGLIRLDAAGLGDRLPTMDVGHASTLTGFADLALEYLESPLAALFDRWYGEPPLVRIVTTGMPCPVFAALMDVFGAGTRDSLAGPMALARFAAGDVEAGVLDWDEVPGWARHDPGSVRIFELDDDPDDGRFRPLPQVGARWRSHEETRVVGIWVSWHPAYAVLGPAAPHPARWHAAGFTPQEAIAAWTSGEAPDAETLDLMAALRRGRRPGPLPGAP